MKVDKVILVNIKPNGYGAKNVLSELVAVPKEFHHEILEFRNDLFRWKPIGLSLGRSTPVGPNIEELLEIGNRPERLYFLGVVNVLGDFLTTDGTVATSDICLCTIFGKRPSYLWSVQFLIWSFEELSTLTKTVIVKSLA